MTQFTETLTETFKVISCYTCGVRFGIGIDLYRRVVTDANGSVYCPACGKLTCWIESESQKRIRELERKLAWEMSEVTRQKEARSSAEQSAVNLKSQLTRLKNRALAGVCPCCKRTFRQLQDHMKTKHPEFKPREL